MLDFIKTAYATSHCTPGTGIFDEGIPGGFRNLNQCDPDFNIFLTLIFNITQLALLLAGGVAVIMLMVGGITYIFSRSRPDLMEQAFNTIKYAVIGVIVIVLSYAIIAILNSFIQRNL